MVKHSSVFVVWLAFASCTCGDPQVDPVFGRLVLSPASVDFGGVLAGTSSTRSVELRNDGRGPLAFKVIELTGESGFSLEGARPERLQPGATFQVTLRFAPSAARAAPFTARLAFGTDSLETPDGLVALSGLGVEGTAGPCERVVCADGGCGPVASPAGAGCNDDDACTVDDRCDGLGGCVGRALACARDAGACEASVGRCEAGTCVYAALDAGVPCDDAQACSRADRCDGQGACVGETFTCLTPAPRCVTASTARAFSAGACLGDGGCSFTETDTPCPLGCDADAGQCASSCPANQHACQGACVSDLAVATCGQRCTPCTGAPANAVDVCAAGACDFACASGWLRVGAGCTRCDVSVPSQVATLTQALAMAPVPGVVCLEAGVHTEDVRLRPHVQLRGVGPASVLVGHLSIEALADADPTPTVVSDLTLRSGYLAGVSACPANNTGCSGGVWVAGQTLALELARVRFVANVASGTVYFGHLDVSLADAGLNLQVRDCDVETDRGFRVVPRLYGPGVVSMVAERNRVRPADGGLGRVYGAFEFLPSCSTTNCAPGSRFQARFANNEVLSSWGEAFYLGRAASVTASDRAASGVEIVNATVVCTAPTEYAVWDNSVTTFPQVTVANTLAFSCHSQLVRGNQPYVLANLQPAVSPFVDVDAGDLRLRPGSPAIDTASTLWAPPDDVLGLSRPIDGDADGTALPDVGAREFRP